MRAKEFNEDISRRGFLRGAAAGAAAGAAVGGGLGTLGLQSLSRGNGGATNTDNKGSPEPVEAPRSPYNRSAEVTPQKSAEPVVDRSGQSATVVQKYSPEVLKQYLIDYAKKYLPSDQVVPFISQVAHESRDFTRMTEVLGYSAPVLAKKYPKLFSPKLAHRVAEDPNKHAIIANTIYANRMGNGDYRSGDGYRYRGRGYIQLTGRENYEKFGKLLGIDLVNNPDLAAQPNHAARIAVSYWNTRVANKSNPSNIKAVTKNIAGSSKQGIRDRMDKFKQYSKELGNKVLQKKTK